MNAVARRAATCRGDRLPWPVSLFGERAVSSPRPTFQTATRAASVKRGAEQPTATRSAFIASIARVGPRSRGLRDRSGWGGSPLRADRRWRGRIGASQGGAVDTDGDAMMLKPIDQRVDQRLLVEQPVPVWQIEICGDDCRYAVVALIHQPEERVCLFRLDR